MWAKLNPISTVQEEKTLGSQSPHLWGGGGGGGGGLMAGKRSLAIPQSQEKKRHHRNLRTLYEEAVSVLTRTTVDRKSKVHDFGESNS